MFLLEESVGKSDVLTSTECQSRQGEQVIVQGFIQRIRSLGGANFIVLRDNAGTVQVFTEPNTPGFKDIKEGYIVTIRGLCRTEIRAPGGFEITAQNIEVLVAPPEEIPLTINKETLNLHIDVDINNRPITLRHPRYRHLFKIQEGLARGFREYLMSKGFTEIFTPKIVGTGTEGGANIFKLDYFGRPAYLAQSPQLYKQMMVGVYGRVFEIAHVFRAEPHDTARHLNEYVSMDLEMGFINSFHDIMAIETGYLNYVFKLLKNEYAQHVEALRITLPDASKIPVVHLSEAHDLVLKHLKEDFRGEEELNAREERLLGRVMREQYGCDLIFVTHYGSSVRPFYAMDDPENPKETLSFDLLFKGEEITTGGQRIHEYGKLLEKMKVRGMDAENLNHYLMIFKYGMPPHGGLGIGIERLTSLLAGYDNVRYGSLFPRDILRLAP